MALKRNFQSLETFSMSSMTDVIFLLLIFFMVTSTIIFTAAIYVQTSEKPITEVYIDRDEKLFLVTDRNDSANILSIPKPVTIESLKAELSAIQAIDSTRAVALYADSTVDYGKVVRVLDIAARNNLRMVLATRAISPDETSSAQ